MSGVIVVSGAASGSTTVATTGLQGPAGTSNIRAVAAYGSVDSTGATDSSAAFLAAITALTGTGLALYIPSGTYKLNTGLTLPNNFAIVMTPDTRLVANLSTAAAPFGSANCLFSAQGSPGATTTLTADVVPGAKTVSLTASLGLTVGSSFILSQSTWQGQAFIVRAISGVGPYTVTLDRPILYNFSHTLATVQTLPGQPQNIHIYGNGASVSGVCLRYAEIITARDCSIRELNWDNDSGTNTDYPMSWDSFCYNCFYYRVNGRGVGAGIVLENDERSYMIECSHTGGAQQGLFFDDCIDCAAIDCAAYNNGTAGLLVTSQAATPGCTGFVIQGGMFCGNGTGIDMGVQTGTKVIGATCRGNGTGVHQASGSSQFFACDLTYNTSYGANISGDASFIGGDVSSNTSVGILANGATIRATGIYANAGNNNNDGSLTRGHFGLVGASIVYMNECNLTVDATTGIGAYINGANSRIVCRNSEINVPNGCYGLLSLIGSGIIHADGSNHLFGAGAVLYTAAGDTARRRGLRTSSTQTIGGYSDIGTVVANGATPVAVAFPDLQANDRVMLVRSANGGTPGKMPLVTKTPGTGFSITADAGDTSTYDYEVG